MALVCVACGSDTMEALADRARCLHCGAHQDFEGTPSTNGLAWTSERPLGAEDPREGSDPVVLKNQADRKTGGTP